ncbi:MAG: hypothetical protein OHK006_19540 [Thermodesulfovibrionales bacterium]
MKHHTHTFVPIAHPSLSAEAKTLGIMAAEVRKCSVCDKQTTYIQLRGTWVPLFEEAEADEQDILLA